VRSLKSLSLTAVGAMLAAGTVLATGTGLAAGPAMADPIANHGGKSVAPKAYDIVGVGSDTDDSLFDQLAYDYDTSHKTHNATHPYIYSWDATPPSNPLNLSSSIVPKSGCAKIARPDGSGPGITQFEAPNYKTAGHLCVDFARSASYRPSSDPDNYGKDLYVALAEDAESYAVSAGGNAPANLTVADLVGIYSCTITNWDQVGGKNAPIEALLPPTTAGVTKFWLTALGLKAAAACVNQNNTLIVQQNEGIDTSVFGTKGHPNPNIIVPYSVGKYIAQRYHSAAVGKAPTGTQNKFGRDEHGALVLGSIGGIAPTVGTGAATKINSSLRKAGNFTRPLYDVVWFAVHSKNNDHIPTYLEPFFAAATGVTVKGWFCANSQAQKSIESYGFLTTRECGLGT
jgi:ABC-type phosphate transport system substrate-binding protein